MMWRRGALLVVRPLRKIPYAALSFIILASEWFLGPRWPGFRLLSLVLLSFLAVLALWRSGRFKEGRIGAQRRVEAGFVGLAVIETASGWMSVGFGLEGFRWLALPYFLFLIYADFSTRALAFLWLFHIGVQGTAREWSWPEFFVLLLSGFVAFWFRSQERRKREGISDRLKSYEREAGAIATRSEEFQEILRLEEKKNEHLANMIQEREAGFKALLEVLHRTLAPQTAALFLFDPLEDTFLLKEHLTSSDRFARRNVYPAQGIFKAVLKEGTPIRMTSASGELRGLTYYDGPPLARSVAAVPLKSDQTLKGIVILDRTAAGGFSDAELETIRKVAGELARLIDTSETLHAYFHLKEELTHLYAASSALSRNLRIEEVLQTLLQSTRKIVPYDLGLVILHDAQNGLNRVSAGVGSEAEPLIGETFACAPERGLVSWVVRNQAPLSYSDFRSREGKTPLFHRRWPLPNLYDSVFVVPMQVQGEPLGAVLFAAAKNRFFSRNERKMLEVVIHQAAISIKNARMVLTLEQLATTDGLTGLKNHRTFQETLARELERSGRHPSPTSLLLADIDHFKKFNDDYGHPAGDFVLKEIGGVLFRAVRKIDTVSRYGGEEFAIILVHTSAAGALQMAERIVHTVAHNRFQYQGTGFHVTVSIGAAAFPEDAGSREALVDSADRALYEAKRTGRNRAAPYRSSLGKLDPKEVETHLIRSAEEEVRRIASFI